YQPPTQPLSRPSGSVWADSPGTERRKSKSHPSPACRHGRGRGLRNHGGTLDTALEERLEAATLRQLCEHVSVRLGPFGTDPVNLMFAVHGHLRRLLRTGGVRLLDP